MFVLVIPALTRSKYCHFRSQSIGLNFNFQFNMLKQIVPYFFLLTSGVLHSQTRYEGIILDSLTKEPLPYVNINFGLSKGLITNEEGKYAFYSETRDTSVIQISHLGYISLSRKAMELRDTILLAPDVLQLNEVVVINTDDLKHKVLESVEKNYQIEESCESFFLKQFSKENGEYINYLETHGIVKKTETENKPDFKVYIKGIRKTENLVTSYINHRFPQLSALLRYATKNILQEGEIVDYSWIDTNFIEAEIRHLETKEVWVLTIDTSDYSIRKVTKNNLTDQLGNPYREQTIYIDGKKVVFQSYALGTRWECSFAKNGEKYYISHIYSTGRGALISKDKSIRHDFESQQQYLITEVLSTCETISSLRPLKKRKSLRELSMKYDEQDWDRFVGILPLKEQQKILDKLGSLN